MRRFTEVIVAIGVLAFLVAPGLAQQTQYRALSQHQAVQSQQPAMQSESETVLDYGNVGKSNASGREQQRTMRHAQTIDYGNVGKVNSSGQEQQGAMRQARTIDCPPSALPQQQPTGAIGTPQGAGTGSGLNAMPSVGGTQKLEGTVKAIDSTRTNRIIEVGDLKLEVEPSTVVLVGCKPASVAQLKEGSQIKAAYQVKEPNRNAATVIESQD